MVSLSTSCNILKLDNFNKIKGDMFDGAGLINLLYEKKIVIEKKSFLILGSGGVGSAIAFSLALKGVKRIGIYDLDPIKSQRLYQSLSENFPGIDLNIWDKDIYHVYVSIESKNEVNTNDIISFILNKNKRVIVPKMINKNLIHLEIDQSTKFTKNKLGIREPISKVKFDASLIEIIIVPLLVFDKSGHRVGYGGGYYDRFLKKCKKDCIKVGLSLFEPIEKIKDVSSFDVKLNYGVTPESIFSF